MSPPPDGFMAPSKVAVVHSEVKREYFPTVAQYLTEKDSEKEALAVAGYLKKLGIGFKLMAADENIFASLKKYRPEIILNMTGSVAGKEYLATLVPAAAEVLGIPCTGSSFQDETLAYNKSYIKKMMSEAGIPVPKAHLITVNSQQFPQDLSYPSIVKLNSIHGSVEINKEAVCNTAEQVKKRIRYLQIKYHDAVLVEEFIEGEEFSVICFDRPGLEVYAAKNIFGSDNNPRSFASFEYQWDEQEIGFQKYHDPILSDLAVKGYHACGMRDYGKFDVRQNREGTYYFIDGNTNPAFGPKESDCALGTVMDLYGFSFEKVLIMLFTNVNQRLSPASRKE
ncbi:MAG: D-alanine-D-alanine ligase, D-alanine-D-alanine ligase [Candidatus Gottesmanbacteria bacterium GW2011_GWA2_43_14]|uniref:D-alanine-D-alanine ligase, D-alanine-D-alanine ligase n=1 Tax=Candidatus Gottesmanbacteria bacterium GW2011_GWA2_43_14 TaxID=1618443 RepID=A0A0G1DMG6_9BACT|nr:MAG: D-alanine-D-alanine ligase, D-alanine-D-alanine ligase [Candidatus Gottesmanbacteria bacterium GW2011_GWA2_43_14]